MDNLPVSPLTPNNSNTNTPYTSGFDNSGTQIQQPIIPSGPETPASITKEQNVPETLSTLQTEKSPEIAKSQEVPMPRPANGQPAQNDVSTASDIKAIPAQPSSNKIVDETEKITSLHTLNTNADPLTKEADEEEEKFIKEIEKHHGRL